LGIGWEGRRKLGAPQIPAADFSVKEKDEARPLNCFSADSLNAFIPRFAGV